MNLPQEPLGFRRACFSHAFYATHTGILTSPRSSTPYRYTFTARRTLPYHHPVARTIHGFGAALEPRYIVGAGTLDQ